MEAKTIYTYLGAIAVILVVSAYRNKFGDANSKTDELIREYLLNESPLYGMNKPKLWIHTEYGINAREWRTGERNTTKLNQPYIHTLIKTIIHKCGDDFNVCLIDDASFAKLLPNDQKLLPNDQKLLPNDPEFLKNNPEKDPENNHKLLPKNIQPNLSKTQREYAFMKLLYVYGGIIMPNTFICLKSLTPLLVTDDIPKFGAGVSVMSAKKACPKLREIAEDWLAMDGYHVVNEDLVDNKKQKLLAKHGAEIINPQLLGKADRKGKPILLDDLMAENYIQISDDAFGILIDGNEVLQRSKYKWLAYISTEELMQSQLVLVKYIKASMVDGFSNTKPSIMAI